MYGWIEDGAKFFASVEKAEITQGEKKKPVYSILNCNIYIYIYFNTLEKHYTFKELNLLTFPKVEDDSLFDR